VQGSRLGHAYQLERMFALEGLVVGHGGLPVSGLGVSFGEGHSKREGLMNEGERTPAGAQGTEHRHREYKRPPSHGQLLWCGTMTGKEGANAVRHVRHGGDDGRSK
jgi:hypothetical protein